MRNAFTLSALLIIILCQSQTYRFIYEMQYKMDSTENGLEKLNMILDIGNNPLEIDKAVHYPK